MLKKTLLWLTLFTSNALAACGSTDQSEGQAHDPRIAEFLSSAAVTVEADGVVGAGLALVIDGRLAYAGGVGSRSRGGASVDGDTLFLSGSTTKLITAATVMSLVEQGKLDLHAPLTTYLPKLTASKPFEAREMSLARLLSHSAGLEDAHDEHCGLPRFSAYGATEPVTLWGNPGTFFDYSNNGYALAAQAIETIVGAGGFEQAVHDRVFSPAGMTSATFAATSSASNLATGYLSDASGAFTKPVGIAQTVDQCPLVGPAGGAIVSAHDFGKLIETLLAGGGAMLEAGSVSLMETGVIATGYRPNHDERYGYGLFVADIGGQRVLYHSGDLSPFHSLVLFVPESRFGIAVLINSASPETLSKLVYTAVGLFAPPPNKLAPPIKTSASEWAAYAGTYVDSYGLLGTFSLTVGDSSLIVSGPDGSQLGSLVQINADYWLLNPSVAGAPQVAGVFMRDEVGAVTQVVTRRGVALRKPDPT